MTIIIANTHIRRCIYMWNQLKSAKLSLIVCWIAMVMFAGCLLAMPVIFNLYFMDYRGFTPIVMTRGFKIVMLTCMYLGVLLAICALYGLIKLLNNITKEKVFVSDNVTFLRIISWCCFGAAIVTVVASFEYFPVIVISIAAAFVGLILRVVKNVMQSAVEIREENDLTI